MSKIKFKAYAQAELDELKMLTEMKGKERNVALKAFCEKYKRSYEGAYVKLKRGEFDASVKFTKVKEPKIKLAKAIKMSASNPPMRTNVVGGSLYFNAPAEPEDIQFMMEGKYLRVTGRIKIG